MGYAVGIDLGTTYTAAAVTSGSDPHVIHLGNRAAAIPSVVFLHDGTMLTGDAALRRGLSDPKGLAREFKRRVGDPVPMVLGGVPLSAEVLFGRLLRWTADVVAEREGGPPDQVAVCHPANWGPYKLELLSQACRIAELSGVTTVSEPEAAAIHYAAQERTEPGALVAVYDLGGGTFDAAVLRKTHDGFEVLGAPEGIERLGGIDFDEAIVAHVRSAIEDALAGLDLENTATLAALARLRQECVDAKEALSADVETSIPVVLPGLQTEVRLTRAEFEGMIRVPLMETIAALRRAVRSARVEPSDLDAVLLVGGSSRIPMVAEMVGHELERPVAVDADPKHSTALGAARAARSAGAAEPVSIATSKEASVVATTTAPVDPVAAPPDPPGPSPAGSDAAGPEPSPEPEPAPVGMAPAPVGMEPEPAEPTPAPLQPTSDDTPRRRSRRLPIIVAGAVAAVALLAVGLVLALGGGGGSTSQSATGGRASAGWVTGCPPSGSPAACITSATLQGDRLAVDFRSQDLDQATSTFNGQPGTVFFLANLSQDQAGGVIARTSNWRPWGQISPFSGTNSAGQQGFSASDIRGATAICVLLGTSGGQVATNSGNCAQLPPAP
jgi:actin-like ATPase involved in cell morphogenesis